MWQQRAFVACMHALPVFVRMTSPFGCVLAVWWPGALAGRAAARKKVKASAARTGRPRAADICMRVEPDTRFFGPLRTSALPTSYCRRPHTDTRRDTGTGVG